MKPKPKGKVTAPDIRHFKVEVVTRCWAQVAVIAHEGLSELAIKDRAKRIAIDPAWLEGSRVWSKKEHRLAFIEEVALAKANTRKHRQSR